MEPSFTLTLNHEKPVLHALVEYRFEELIFYHVVLEELREILTCNPVQLNISSALTLNEEKPTLHSHVHNRLIKLYGRLNLRHVGELFRSAYCCYVKIRLM